MMTPIENLYYAIGEMAYAVARTDGEVQKEERQKFCDIVTAELRSDNYGFDISSIVFQVMDKDHRNAEEAYQWGLKQIRQNGHYLSPQMKTTFINVMEKIAAAYPPVTSGELNLIDRFKKDIALIHGDPVYYSKNNSK